MGRNAIENEQQQMDNLIIMIYFSFDHVDTTNLYETNGFVYQLYANSLETNASDWLVNVFNLCGVEKHANELKRVHNPIITFKIIEGVFLIKEHCIFNIIPGK